MFDDWDDVGLVALLIWSEARGEPYWGQMAVGWVVRNRVERHGYYGDSIRSVILNPWDFSWFNPFTTGIGKKPEVPVAASDFRLMAGSILDGSVADPSGGATHFYATWLPAPIWVAGSAMRFLCEIGQHRFYREG